MEIHLLRHTSAADPHGYFQDADRPLTERGGDEALVVATAMRHLRIAPDLVLTSPYLRARQTARVICEYLALEPPADTAALLPGAESRALIREIASHAVHSVLAVGHAPDLAIFVSMLCWGEEIPFLELAKGTLVTLATERPLRPRRALIRAVLPLTTMERVR